MKLAIKLKDCKHCLCPLKVLK